uniref:Adhesion G protein-coupled receptor F7 n=1 Tax=Tetraodon nigroviridis TaxID=99883 RepID=H3C1P7_TETNG
MDKEFTPDLNNQASLAYKELELKLNLVLKDQYRQITGFIRAFVKAFRQGSIIVDFEVQTTQLNYSEIAAANSQLPTAMKSVATLLGDPVASYQIFRYIICKDDRFGTGRTGDQSTIWCDEGLEGSITAVCEGSGNWKTGEDTCIVTAIKELLIFSEQLTEVGVPEFAGALNAVVQSNKSEISNSSLTISVVVNIVNKISVLSHRCESSCHPIQDVLETVDAIISEDSRDSWIALNLNKTDNSSSELLGSLEGLSDKLVGEFEIETGQVILNKTSFSDPFVANVNSSVTINISNTSSENASVITTMLLTGLINVMPTRNQSINNETDNTINAAVVLVKIDTKIGNVILTFNKLNNTLKLNPQCVFWNFTAFNNLGAWDDFGCTFVSDINDIVTCNCTHLTSFSILMSTRLPVVRPGVKVALDLITYVGVGISLASLVICLILEGYVWKAVTRNSTAFMRHVSIVNTALSLLIADICFIIAASFAKNPGENPGEDYNVPVGPCSAATFFMHLFYLALFFWMLVSGLLLFYRTVMIFSHMSKSAMLAIGFCLGYGCPLVIAVVTVAVTAPSGGYVQGNEACWLNWTKSKALLALVIPALTIVLVNILILIVIITKILSRDVGESVQTDEKHALVVIARCVIILTPLFGLTWSLGVGTMVSSTNEGIHIAFAFFNSLQGFFILVFGTLLDSKVRSVLSKKATTSTS